MFGLYFHTKMKVMLEFEQNILRPLLKEHAVSFQKITHVSTTGYYECLH